MVKIFSKIIGQRLLKKLVWRKSNTHFKILGMTPVITKHLQILMGWFDKCLFGTFLKEVISACERIKIYV